MNQIGIYIKNEKVYLKIGKEFYSYNKENFTSLNIKQASCNEIKKSLINLISPTDKTIDEEYLVFIIECTSDDNLSSCSLTLKLSITKENNKQEIKIYESISSNYEKRIELINFINDNYDKSICEIVFDLISFFISTLFGEYANDLFIQSKVSISVEMPYEEALKILEKANEEENINSSQVSQKIK